MISKKAFNPSEEKSLSIRARMTQIQIESLALRLKPEILLNELSEIKYFKNFIKCKNCNINEIKKWVINGWNTEYLLVISKSQLSGDALKSSLHWAFPQAYYSVYSISMAFFHIAGITANKHSTVIGKVGLMMEEGKYPKNMSFFARGIPKNISFTNIDNMKLPNTLYFKPKPEIIDAQICQFLGATRKNDLKEKKTSICSSQKKEKRKKHFSVPDWDRAAKSLGITSIFSLLYRKRIKSNYQEIDTFLSNSISPEKLYVSLINIVRALNLIHEAYIIRGLGRAKYCSLTSSLMPEIKDIVELRMLRILKVCNKLIK